MHERVFKDKEIVWFYGIVLGLLALTFVLVVTDREWLISLLPVISMIGVSYFGWPLKARIIDSRTVVFIGLLRTIKVTSKSIASVGIVGAYDYRAQLRLRNRHDVQIGYRCRHYDHAPELAQALLNIIKKAPNAKVDSDAIKLLQQVASGKTTPLGH